jgi:Oxidoreductase family, NAD-binding Rossmann fold
MSSTHDGLRVGFLGAGRWSTLWADAVVASERFSLSGVVEPNVAVADAFRRRIGLPRVADVESLAIAGTNLWLVGTPTASHLRDAHAIAAATKGPVIIVVASPVALDPGQVSEMERLETGRVRIVPAHDLQYGAAAWLRGRIPKLGAIEAIEARYEMPANPGTVSLSAVEVGLSGGGVGMDLMPELLDLNPVPGRRTTAVGRGESPSAPDGRSPAPGGERAQRPLPLVFRQPDRPRERLRLGLLGCRGPARDRHPRDGRIRQAHGQAGGWPFRSARRRDRRL